MDEKPPKISCYQRAFPFPSPCLNQRPFSDAHRLAGGDQKSNAAFLASQQKLRKKREIEVAQESMAERRRLAEDATEFERHQRKEAWRAREAGRALRDSRREQVQVSVERQSKKHSRER